MKDKSLLLVLLFACTSLFAQNYHWTASNYQYTMVANCIVTIDGVEQFNEQLELGAFCGDECRGRAMALYFPLSNQYVVPLSIGSNTGEGDEFTFKLYDHAHDLELDLTCHTMIQFQDNAVVGNMTQWMEIEFESNSVPETHWNARGFQYTMSVSGIVMIEDVEQYDGQLEVGAFCGDDCRGSAMAQFFPMTNQYVVPLSIGSDGLSGEKITFRLYNHTHNQEMDLNCVSSLEFSANEIVGNPGAWYQYKFDVVCRFIGTINEKWSVAGNWKNNLIPDADKTVLIEAPCVLDVDATVKSIEVAEGRSITLGSPHILMVTQTITTTDCSQLVIVSGAQLYNNTDGVCATFEREIAGYGDAIRWNFIASPMITTPVDVVVSGTLFDLYQYDEPLAYWMRHDDEEYGFMDFNNGRGYLYAVQFDRVVKFIGVLRPSGEAVRISLSAQREGELNGFNLVGNPFPCNAYVDFSYYELDASGNGLVEGIGPIAPGKAVLVKANAPGQVVTFTRAEW